MQELMAPVLGHRSGGGGVGCIARLHCIMEYCLWDATVCRLLKYLR